MRRLATLALGSALLAGGAGASTSADRIAPSAAMTAPRACHSATLLHTGRVLVAGGFRREDDYVLRSELYDPHRNRFLLAARILEPRLCHTATLLRDGRVLLAGGSTRSWLASAELYDPRSGRFSATGQMSVARGGATATLLRDGRVLVAGGFDGRPHASAELFDPQTGTWERTGSLGIARDGHTATRLRDGRVLVTGGRGTGEVILRSAEIYDPARGLFTGARPLVVPRHKHGAVLLADGDVLVVGGADARDWRGRYRSTEAFDSDTGRFTPGARMGEARFKLSAATVVLPRGRVLVAGGSTSVETFDPRSKSFRFVAGNLDADRFYTTATALPDGGALIAGGYGYDILATAKAWRYRP